MESINVIHLNTSIQHSSALLRLNKAFNQQGIKSSLFTMECAIQSENVIIAHKSLYFRILRKIDTFFIGIVKKNYHSKYSSLPFSFFNVGMNLAKEADIKSADVIIIHWTGGSFLSLHGLEKIFEMGKMVIIACHDNGHFTGGCHVLLGCEKYKNRCGECPQLGSKNDKDISYIQLMKKKKIYEKYDFVVVSPSRWTDDNVSNSYVFRGKKHFIIPNVIDTDTFKKISKDYLRKKYSISNDAKIILFGAIGATEVPHKGYKELLRALDIFSEKYPDIGEVNIYIFGSNGSDSKYNSQFTMHYMGYLKEQEIAEAYNISDIYVVPSLEDSFNNTVAEALSTETPVVSFATGGITDIIDHKKNGYLAKYGDSDDLANGIYWVMNNNPDNCLGINGRTKVLEKFSYEPVVNKYKELFNEVL